MNRRVFFVLSGLLCAASAVAIVGTVAAQQGPAPTPVAIHQATAAQLAIDGYRLDAPGPGESAALTSDAALARLHDYFGVGSPAIPIRESVLAKVRSTRGPRTVDALSWVFAINLVPPFQGPGPSREATTENTYFLGAIDAMTGEVVFIIGGDK